MGKLNKTDYWLWAVIALYTGFIYCTVHLVSKWRKALTEKYGYEIFDSIYWIFGALGIFLIFYIYKKHRTTNLIKPYLALIIVSLIYLYYLMNLKYAVERIHFLQYGLLGALVFLAFRRHLKIKASVICGICVTFWLGLGDEFIQHLLPSRVGEIKDCLINAVSGALGIALMVTVFSSGPSSNKNSTSKTQSGPQLKSNEDIDGNYFKKVSPPAYVLAATSLFTAIFISFVHGFGNRHMHLKAGIIYSSLSAMEFKLHNAGKEIPSIKIKAYQDEARRHLLQREYYCSNDFLNNKGKFYRRWDKCYMENKILEIHYPKYLRDNASDDVYEAIAIYDMELAEKVKGNPTQWTKETIQSMEWAKPKERIFTSRVKSIIITRYELKDLWFYTLLIISFIFWIQHKFKT